jgi:hypothetical protein
MPTSVSEKSFGQRYTKAVGLAEYLKLIPTYAPDNAEIAVVAFDTFLGTVQTANETVSTKLSELMNERESRLILYKGPEGLIKLCARVRDYIASIDPKGRKSADYNKISKTMMRMRGQRLSKKPDPPADGGTAPKTLSTSEQSYGSVLEMGVSIVEVVKAKAGYAPSNAALTVAGLNTFMDSLYAKNRSVASKQETYDNAVEDRMNLYTDLQKRITQIKSALAGQFGRRSNEYTDSLKY